VLRDQVEVEEVAIALLGPAPGRHGHRGRRLWWNCPFHEDPNPSFVIDPARPGWKCFGCGEHGDAADLVMRLERLTFPEAVRWLADQFGRSTSAYTPLLAGAARSIPAGRIPAAPRRRPPSAHIPDEAVAVVPPEMVEADCWVAWEWKWKQKADSVGEGKWDKPPIDPRTGIEIDQTDPANWMAFEEARRAAREGGHADGTGFAMGAPESPFGITCIDLDHCIDDAGRIGDKARSIVERFDSYTEYTPSGHGLRILVLGTKPGPRCKTSGFPGVELYDSGRYITVTGRHLEGTPTQIHRRDEALASLYAEMFDGPGRPARAGRKLALASVTAVRPSGGDVVHDDLEILQAASRLAGFDALYRGDSTGYPSRSEADLAIMNHLAYLCGPGREAQVIRIYRGSTLGRRRKADRQDYVDRTAARAYRNRTDYFDWSPSANCRDGGEEEEEDRPRLTNFATIAVPRGDKAEETDVGIPAPDIADRLDEITGPDGPWPRRVAETLFVPGQDYRPIFLDSATQMFGWIDRFADVRWKGGASMVSQERFYEYQRKFRAERFAAIERYPHFPPRPDTYYSHPPIRETKDRVLIREFLGFFRFAGDVDRSLGESLLLTLFWGGPPGARPCFLIRGPEDDDPALMGRYVGKTILAALFADLVGGLSDLLEGEEIPAVKTRLLSDEGLERRVLRIDNVKTIRLSWAALEQFITSDVISGKRLYRGEGSRPNTITTVITMNGGSLSKDMATRVVTIRLARPPIDDGWRLRVTEFIEKHRWDLIAEIRGRLEDECGSIVPRGRWPEWQADVLGKVRDYPACQKAIAERCTAIDSDDEAAEIFEDQVRHRLAERGHEPSTEFIRIPSGVMGVWYSRIHKAHVAAKTATEKLDLLPLKRLRYCRTKSERFWLWSGEDATGDPNKPCELKPDPDTTTPTHGVAWGE
jgi:hypothetical protein